MKKFLMSLLTSIFVGSTVAPIISCNTDKTNNKVEPIKKHEITESNLDEFFKIHNTFEYKGEFFFKDISKQSEDEIWRVNHKVGPIFFKYCILNETFGTEFNKYFNYNPDEFIINLASLKIQEWSTFNETHFIKFTVKINKLNKEVKYNSTELVLNFIETKQYDEKKWLEKYLLFLSEASSSIWEKKYEPYKGSFLFVPYAEYIDDDKKNRYLLINGNEELLGYISDEFTKIFSAKSATSVDPQWLYEDKKFKVKVTSYEYMDNLPKEYKSGEGVIAKIHLIFSYFNSPNNKEDVKAEIDAEIWMEYSKEIN